MSSTAADRFDAVVVGSGFGGSVTALRLAQAGRSVLVLERGRRWRPEDFPLDVRDVDRVLWRYPRRSSSTGLFDPRFLSGAGVLAASGVGGGSLVYANVCIRPEPRVFDDPRWPQSTTRASLDPYYDRVARELGVAPVPADVVLAKRDAFRAAAERVGRPAIDVDQAVDWEACRLVSQCEFGCPHGAKHGLDRNYLARAEELGGRVTTGAWASLVAPERDGYAVIFRDVADGTERRVRCSRLVLAAGTLGTNELLLRSRDVAGTLPDLSPVLGQGFSANGDFIGTLQNADRPVIPWHGPDVTTVIPYLDADPGFTLAAPGFSREATEVLASLGQARGRWLRVLEPLWPTLGRLLPWLFARGILSRPLRLRCPRAGDPQRMTNLFAIGRDDAGGRLLLGGGRLQLEWDYARANAALVRRQIEAMREIGEAYGATFAPVFTWSAFRRPLTVHPLGGCRPADSPARGVVSPEGEVHGYPGLYVADGSVVASSLGFHPAMTIAALAERTAEAVVRSFPA